MVKIELELSESQWCELANAVGSKIALVRNNAYGELDDDHDPEAWARELESVYNRIADELQKRGVPY